MKKIDVPNSLRLGALGAYQWSSSGKTTKELVLSSQKADEMQASAMHVNLTGFSAFNDQGQEIIIQDFPGQCATDFKGISSGEYIRTKATVALAAGRYTKIRFYIDATGSSCQTYQRRQIDLTEEYLDFDVSGGFEVAEGDSPELLIRFNFLPFETSKVSRKLSKIVLFPVHLGYKLSSKLQQSFGA